MEGLFPEFASSEQLLGDLCTMQIASVKDCILIPWLWQFVRCKIYIAQPHGIVECSRKGVFKVSVWQKSRELMVMNIYEKLRRFGCQLWKDWEENRQLVKDVLCSLWPMQMCPAHIVHFMFQTGYAPVFIKDKRPASSHGSGEWPGRFQTMDVEILVLLK